MLFNSLPFLFLFLPVTFAGFYLAGRWNIVFLILASLVFYCCWHAPDALLLLASMGVNYPLGRRLQKKPTEGLLWLGIALNAGVIGWFKYAHFFADNINALTGGHLPLPDVILPLGVSFFTLHEITWIVDSYLGKIKSAPLKHYVLYITFFPQVIAGPIVRYTQVMDQYNAPGFGKFDASRFAQGALMFCIGLCKKVLLADQFELVTSPVFHDASAGMAVTSLQAWVATVLYSFQVYFDFSGYTDMAIGLGLAFGIALPLNFNSPYKATSMIEFWRRWHMTLSRFLRDYLYVPLCGRGGSAVFLSLNLMVVMLIGGLWHGAAWTFVIWGLLHGTFLIINHAWRRMFPPKGKSELRDLLGGALTYLVFTVSIVFFRAESLDGALAMLRALAGRGGAGEILVDAGSFRIAWVLGLVSAWIIWFTPNTQEIGDRFARLEGRGWRYASLALGAVTGFAVFLTFTGIKSDFIYFRF